MSQDNLKVDFPGICEIVFKGDCIKAKSKIDDWNAESAALDQITNELSRLAESRSLRLWDRWDCEDCIMAYSCDDKEKAKGIFAELRDFKPKEPEASPQASAKESADKRIDARLQKVQEAALADIFKWKLNVPAYQRPYSWEQRNVESLWDDIKESGGHYDIGMIVIIKSGGSYDIVDGQQRLVTISLMLRSLGSSAANAFMQNTRLQGRASEENIACNLRWLRRQAARLESQEERDAMAKKILEARADVVVMDDLDDALKFFNRMNTAGVELTQIDILKSHHLLALASENALTDEAKARWQKKGFVPDACLDNPKEFKDEIVRQWEGCDADWLATQLSRACALRMMACGEKPYTLDNIDDKDIEQLRRGDNPSGKYTGLDSPMQDGEFFFWYAFNLWDIYKKLVKDRELFDEKRIINERENYDAHMVSLRHLLYWGGLQDFFELLVVYMHEKFPDSVNSEKFNKAVDLLFLWIAGLDLSYGSFRPQYVAKNAVEDGNPFMALVSSKTLDDCFDCYCENPLDYFASRGWPNASGNNNYLIRRELRRIWQDLYL